MLLDSQSTSIGKTRLNARGDLHLLRKLWHMGTGLVGLYLYFNLQMEPRLMAFILLTVALIGFGVDSLRLRNEAANKLAIKFMGPFMRESEKSSYSGLPFYALGVSTSLLLFEEKVAVLGILFLVFADPISSAVGILIGKDKILGGKKSLQGSAAGFVTCYLISLIYCLNYSSMEFSILGFAIMAGLIGSISEMLSIYVDDNLTVPIISGAGLSLLNNLYQIL